LSLQPYHYWWDSIVYNSEKMDISDESWKHKISNIHQIGGIETSVLDNGPAKGTRIAWINTGSGLRYKVVLDRAMDIADAFFNQNSLSWLSHAGITSPQPFSDGSIDWLRTFGGGLVTTCGLTHVGGPESDEHGNRGLHGHISNIPAQIESIIQPDLLRGNMDMSITGVIRETRPFGPCLELRRTVSSKLGESSIHFKDEITNYGNTPSPHMILYHINLGWPLVSEGARILWDGDWKSRDNNPDNPIFNRRNDFKKCLPPLDTHKAGGEEAVFVDITANEEGICQCGIYNESLEMAFIVSFPKQQLPWMTNWQHWGPGEYVTGLEPGSHPPIGQKKAREEGSLKFIQPGETVVYDMKLEVVTQQENIKKRIQSIPGS